MGQLLLYSTNVFLKLLIQEQYRGDEHYVWCSESFDSSKQNTYSISSMTAPSSNPASIYRELWEACEEGDLHSSKITEQRLSFKTLAVEWEKRKEITPEERDEITFWSDSVQSIHWKPLIYVIPRAAVENRLIAAPAGKRASMGKEWIIADLQRSEFDIMEFKK